MCKGTNRDTGEKQNRKQELRLGDKQAIRGKQMPFSMVTGRLRSVRCRHCLLLSWQGSLGPSPEAVHQDWHISTANGNANQLGLAWIHMANSVSREARKL